jgi:hypothetical protein
MVTPEFLNECAKKYMANHLKLIATMMMNVKITKTPHLFFGSFEPLVEHLNALIAIETLYPMKNPLPSKFKADLLAQKDIYMDNMIKRCWHEAKSKQPPGGNDSVFVREHFQKTADELMLYRDHFGVDQKSLIDVFYSAIFKRNYGDPATIIDEAAGETDEAAFAEAATGAMELPHL